MMCKKCGVKPKSSGHKSLCNWCYTQARLEKRPELVERQRAAKAKWRERNQERTTARRLSPEGKYKHLIHMATRRGLKIELSLEEYSGLTVCAFCTYCGGDLPKQGHGLDRINNSRGYTIDNVVPCCKECNSIRNNMLSPTETRVVAQTLKLVRLGLVRIEGLNE